MALETFRSQTKLVVFALKPSPDLLPYKPEIGRWYLELDPWRSLPTIAGQRLELLGVTPRQSIEIPAGVEALAVAPLDPETFKGSTLKAVLKQIKGDARVRGLLLANTHINPEDLYALRDHPWELLDFRSCVNLFSQELSALKLKAFSGLRGLRLPAATPASFLRTLKLPKLRYLELGSVSGELDAELLRGLLPPTLEHFQCEVSIGEEGIQVLADLPALRALSLLSDNVEHLRPLQHSPVEALSLWAGRRRLLVSGPQDYAAVLRGFAGSKLKQLMLRSACVNASLREAVAQLKGLRSLSLAGPVGLSGAPTALPDVPVLGLEGVELSDGHAPLLESLERVEELSLFCELDSPRSKPRLPLRALERLPAPERLRRLSLTRFDCRPGNEDILAVFSKLEALSVTDTPLQLMDVVLEELTELRELRLAGTWVTELAEHIHQALRALDVRDTAIPEAEQATLVTLESLEALALGEYSRTSRTKPPMGVSEDEAPIPRSPDEQVLTKLAQTKAPIHTLWIQTNASVTEQQQVELARSLPHLVALRAPFGFALARAAGVPPPKLATREQLQELRRMRRDGLDDYEFFKACDAIWHDGLTIDEIAGMPRDEVADLLASLEGF